MRCEWKKTTLGELYEFASGLSKGAKDFGFGLPFLSFKTVFNNYFVPDKIHDLANTTAQEQKKCSIHEGDVFLTRTSETINELGMSCVALQDYPFATFNGFTKRLRPKDKTKIYPKYAAFYFRSATFRSIVNGYTILTTRASLNNETLQRLPMILPSFDEQKAIGDLLFSLHNKIDLNNKINANLEAQAQAIFKSWFVDFAPFQNGEFVDSELGQIPKGWRVGMLNDIAEITMGQSPKGDSYNENGEGTVFYQGRGEFGNRFPVTRLYTTEPKRMAKKNDILMSVRAPVGDINVAKEDCCIGRGLAAIRSNSNHSSFLLYLMLNMKAELNIYNGEGTVFGSINKKELNGMKIIIPQIEAINKYENMIQSVDNKIINLCQQNQNLAAIRDILLPKLMSGEIEVPISIDEIIECYD